MKAIFFLSVVLCCLITYPVLAQVDILDSTVRIPNHPRLLLLHDQEKTIIANISTDKGWNKMHQFILAECDSLLNSPALTRIKIGRRLLNVSRECLKREFYLSYAYRLTQDKKYLKKAEEDMLAVASFSDWNPTHFLDVAEMTMGVSIGYDWLYDDLPEQSRIIIKEAILKKGIEPSLHPVNNSWLKSNNNWNQVCNAGIAYGAIATYEDHPTLSLQIINRAIETITLPMQLYAPDGAYPEGYTYWEYGTSFNVMFISALEAAFGKDFGLSEKPGFLQTATYMEHMTGVSGRPFNYSDSRDSAEFNPAMFWFANRSENTSLLWVVKQQQSGKMNLKNRLLPAAMIWGKNASISKAKEPNTLMWTGGGTNPVALMRTSWTDPQAIFVGFKGGSPSVSHAHMDAGTFIMEADGVRWGIDLGMQEYESLESKGINLWDGKQNGGRWKIFRYNNLAHNTLTINNEFQDIKGAAPIISQSTSPDFMNAVADLTSLYNGKISKITRGVAILDKAYVVVRDELETAQERITVRWSMITQASVKIINKNTAELTKNGKKLLLKVQEPLPIALKTWSTTPTTDFDAPNPGTTIIGFEVSIPANKNQALSVLLVPEKVKGITGKPLPSISFWSK